MKTLLTALLLTGSCTMVLAQIRTNVKPNAQIKIESTIEKIKIPFTQPPLLHDNGGWEKGPSAWASASNSPVDYRGGLLLLDRKVNGMVRYLNIKIKFKQAGSLEVTANSMGSTSIGFNNWKWIYGKAGEEQTVTIITKEADFGREINLYLRNFKLYQRTEVH